jgi:hypothetical protein
MSGKINRMSWLGAYIQSTSEENFQFVPAGTSSRSTKLVHGDVRYLQKAVIELYFEQCKLVKEEALPDRPLLIEYATHLFIYKFSLFGLVVKV